jgi:hypothetical protein
MNDISVLCLHQGRSSRKITSSHISDGAESENQKLLTIFPQMPSLAWQNSTVSLGRIFLDWKDTGVAFAGYW